ncbi:MAG: hypothetical protein HFE04_03155 [Bacilli bacterium]|nr:hypothetical protein [Bacilli bacterium]
MSRVVDLHSMMSVSDVNSLFDMVERARVNSVNAKKLIRSSKRFSVDVNELKKLMFIILASCASMMDSIGEVKSTQSFQDYDNIKLEDVSQAISSMLYGSSEGTLHGAHYSSILSKNKISDTLNDDNNFRFNHEAIAKDLLKLDGPIFDFAFCSVCVDLGKNINDLVGVGGRTNIDSVIFYLSLYSSIETREVNDYVKKTFDGVDNLNDYLIKYGYVDKNGEPSLEVFRKSCDEHALDVLSSIQDKNDKGASVL